MNNRELSEKITDDLFGGAKQLRQYTEIAPHGKYLAGWSKTGMAARIEHLLSEAGTIHLAAVAAALCELRTRLVADANAMATHGSGTSACTIQDAFDATIAKLGLTEEKK